jgi:hypothetical protein
MEIIQNELTAEPTAEIAEETSASRAFDGFRVDVIETPLSIFDPEPRRVLRQLQPRTRAGVRFQMKIDPPRVGGSGSRRRRSTPGPATGSPCSLSTWMNRRPADSMRVSTTCWIA